MIQEPEVYSNAQSASPNGSENPIQDIHIEDPAGQFVATIAKIRTTVTGATHDEALTNAQHAITARMIAEAEAEKRHSRGKDHTA